MRAAETSRPRRVFFALSVLLLTCVGLFFVQSWRWPQVNDPAQISYLCWLMDHGVRPYKDLIEMNMPGIYMTNWSVMHLLGESSLAWRLFDLGLAMMSGVALCVIALPFDWFAGVLAAALFILFHAHDGPAQMGQRDYIIAVLMLCAYAALFESERRRWPWLLFLFGLSAAATAAYKPQAVLFAAALLLAICWRHARQGRAWLRTLAISLAGMVVPGILVLGFLLHEQAVAAFFHTMATMLPYYAVLDRRPPLELLRRSIVPSVGVLLVLGVVVGWAQRRQWNWERTLLLVGVAFGAISEIAQGKGYIYHRYPLTAFVLLIASIELVLGLRRAGWVRGIAWAGVLYAGLTAVLYTTRGLHRQWDEAYNHALAADLRDLGTAGLPGHIQCLTMGPDCATTLYRLHLAQATGLVYDYFVFGDPHSVGVADARRRFLAQLQANPPGVFILNRWLFPDGPNDYSKLNHWPRFRNYLNAHYTIEAERYFPPAMTGIRGYRLYVRKP